MGPINPIVVTGAALAARGEAIAEGLVASVSNFGGQLCTKPGVVFVPDGPAGDEFADTVAARLDGVEPTVLLNERLRDALAAGVRRLAKRPEVHKLGAAPKFTGEGYRHQPVAYEAPAAAVADAAEVLEEHFGPVVVLLRYGGPDELLAAIEQIDGQLTGSIHARPARTASCWAGSPSCWPHAPDASSSTASRPVSPSPTGCTTAAPTRPPRRRRTRRSGTTAIRRFLRPVAWQNAPATVLPKELRDDNPLGIWRRVDGELTRAPLGGYG